MNERASVSVPVAGWNGGRLAGAAHRLMARRLADPRRLSKGLWALLAIGLAYAACILLLALGGARPNPAPWLAIPPERYFVWEAVFIAPVMFAGGVLAAGSLHLLARAAGGDGRFDDAMALCAHAIALATLTTVVPDTLVGLLLCAGVVSPAAWMAAITQPTAVLALVWFYLLAYTAAFLLLFPAAAARVYGLRARGAIAVGAASFAIYQGFLFVFIR